MNEDSPAQEHALTIRPQKVMSFGRKLVIISIMAFVGFAVIVALPFIANPQIANIAAAGRHIPALRRALDKDARFSRIELRSFTMSGGCLLVRGELDSEEAEADLRAAVAASRPPVKVEYRVFIITPETRVTLERLRREEPAAASEPTAK